MTALHRCSLIAAIAALGLAGCTANFDQAADADSDEIAAASMALTSDNGLSTNGLSTNGLSTNGLSTNGLSTNGLSTNGFAAWFTGQPAGIPYSDAVMKYLVKCALPSGQTRSATINDVTYTWPGLFGLAPTWASGQTIPVNEQQLVSACLAAHVNKYGLNVSFSVLGYDKNSVAIPMTCDELNDFSTKEGCFFGNLFNGDGVFVGNDSTWSSSKSSSRNCAITVSGGSNNNCPPMTFGGDKCSELCTPDELHNAYTSCTYNNKTYLPITTRVLLDDVYKCGDGICQISESCGTGNIPNNCKDCGPCP